jgi:hypothetical protein
MKALKKLTKTREKGAEIRVALRKIARKCMKILMRSRFLKQLLQVFAG